jgi:hypothetical protein
MQTHKLGDLTVSGIGLGLWASTTTGVVLRTAPVDPNVPIENVRRRGERFN